MAELPEIDTMKLTDTIGLPEAKSVESNLDENAAFTQADMGLPEVVIPAADALPEVGEDTVADGLPGVNDTAPTIALPESMESALPETDPVSAPTEASMQVDEPSKQEEMQPDVLEPAKLVTEPADTEMEQEPAEMPTGKRKLDEEEKSRKKQKVVEKAAGTPLQLSLSLDEVQSLMDLKQAAVNANRSFYTIDALLFACKKAMENQPDFDHTTGLRIELQLLPTHLTYQQLLQFRAQLLCHRMLVRNMQPPDRVLHTARGGYNKKEVEYAEFRRNLLPNVPETINEMNEYDKQSRIELANRRAKFWTDLQASGY